MFSTVMQGCAESQTWKNIPFQMLSRQKCDVIEVTLFRTEVINRTLDRLYREAISISVQQALSHANCLGKGSGCDFTCIVFRCRPSQHVRFFWRNFVAIVHVLWFTTVQDTINFQIFAESQALIK